MSKVIRDGDNVNTIMRKANRGCGIVSRIVNRGNRV